MSSNPTTVIFIYLFTYLYNSLNIIHNQSQIISVAEYGFYDKQSI